MMKRTRTQPDIPIVFEDEHLLVIDKPAGMLSQEDHTGDPDAVTLCKKYLDGASYLGLLHRLDRPVGGLMMMAKNKKAADRLSQQVKDRTIQKVYRAVVEGNPPVNGMLSHHLQKNRNRNIVSVVSPDQKKAKRAVLSFARISSAKGLHLLSVHLQTGRPHQIRVQLAHEGYPIWGDYKYGSDQPDGRDIALKATELVFEHPDTNEEIRLETPPPGRFPWRLFE